jgi:hypothetical protein
MSKTFKIHYLFESENQDYLDYEVVIDEESLDCVNIDTNQGPSWTDLGFHQCSNCPLNQGDRPKCPVANNLHHVIENTKNMISHEKTRVSVKTKERTYCKNTTMQEGLFSLFGVLMATSGCPHLEWLKPMVRFHLPFATVEETLFRSLSTFLLHEFLMFKQGQKVEFKIQNLLDRYREVEIVNRGILDRINNVSMGDADKNAIVTLNIFAQMFEFQFSNDFSFLVKLFPDLRKKMVA